MLTVPDVDGWLGVGVWGRRSGAIKFRYMIIGLWERSGDGVRSGDEKKSLDITVSASLMSGDTGPPKELGVDRLLLLLRWLVSSFLAYGVTNATLVCARARRYDSVKV